MIETEIIEKCLEILMQVSLQDGYVVFYKDDTLLVMLPNYQFKLNLFENPMKWKESLYIYLVNVLNEINKEIYKENGEVYIKLYIKNFTEKIPINKDNLYEAFLKALDKIIAEKMLREI